MGGALAHVLWSNGVALIVAAKRPETRAKRINEAVARAKAGQREA